MVQALLTHFGYLAVLGLLVLGGAEALVEGKYAMCPLHNYKFDPRSGRAVEVVCADAKRYAVREKDGDAELWA